MTTYFYDDNTLREPLSSDVVPMQHDIFLATKLHAPHARSTHVDRPALTTRLQFGMEGSLTLLSAPTGFGKTTLLSHWVQTSTLPTAWLSLEPEENEPRRFLSYLIATLQTLYPTLGTATLALLQSPQAVPVEHVMAVLSNEIATNTQTRFILVLDDYHTIQNENIHTAIAFLLEHLPPTLHIIIATRVDPPFSLTRMRVRGQLTELRVSDFRLTAEEVRVFLRAVMGLQLDIDVIEVIGQRTEGWIAGVQLAALSLQSSTNPQTFLQAFNGNNRFVLEYLSEEVFFQQSESIQTFLLTTCIVDRLNASLCDVLTGQSNGQVMLETLEKMNLFFIALDDERQWYRYHQLFAQVLRIRLRQNHALHVPDLHLRASQWYEQHGFLVEAIQHAVHAQSSEHVLVLLEQHGSTCILEYGIPGRVHDWLQTLPMTLVQERAALCLCLAMTYVYTNRQDDALLWLQKTDDRLTMNHSMEHTTLLRGRIAACRSLIQFALGDIALSVDFARQALDLLPETEILLRSQVTQCALSAYRTNGDVTRETEILAVTAVVSARASKNQNLLLMSLTNLAWIQVLRGRLHQAAASYREIALLLPEEEQRQIQMGSPNYYIGLGNVLREWNHLDIAEEHLAHGIEQFHSTPPPHAELVTLGYTAMARLHQARGEYDHALEILERLDSISGRFTAYLLAYSAAVRANIELVRGNLRAALSWAKSETRSADVYPEPLYERVYLILVRVRIAQQRTHPHISVVQEMLSILEKLQNTAEARDRMKSVLEILVLRALALDALNDSLNALTLLELAVKIAEPEDAIRIFADEGLPMKKLLSQLRTTNPRKQEYLLQLQEACVGTGREQDDKLHSPQTMNSSHLLQPLLDPLSNRELEVLHLISLGTSNHDIAEKLVIAVSTVKRHVTNILAKLDVTNRTQAVAQARKQRLL